MANSGGIRHDFGVRDNITPHEARTLRWVAVDAAGALVSDMTGWAVSFFWIPRLDAADGPTALDAVDVLKRTTADGSNPITLTAPNIDCPLLPADWTEAMLTQRTHAYELWRTDSGNQRRLAYGTIAVVH